MKQIFIYSTLFISALGFSQTTIVEKKITDENRSLSFSTDYNNDLLYINEGKVYGSIRGINTVDTYSFDKSDKTNIISNQKFSSYYQMRFDNSYIGTNFSSVGWLTNYKIFDQGKLISAIDKDELDKINDKVFYSKEFIYGLGDLKGKQVENLENEDLYLKIYSIPTKKSKSVKLSTAYFASNIKDYKEENKLYYISKFGKDWFEIVTKYVSKDFKSCLIHRSLYDYQGKFIKSIDLKVSPELNMIFSSNGGASLGIGQVEMFKGNGAVNNFTTDKEENVYVYGLYTTKGSSPYNNPISGYYIIKYDKNGGLLWKTTHEIKDKDVNDNGAKTRTYLFFSVSDEGKLSLKIFKRYNDQYLYNTELETSSGRFINESKTLFKVDSMSMSEYFNAPLQSTLELKELKNIRFGDYSFGFLIYQKDSKIKTYIDNLNKSKEKVYLEFEHSKSGVWLIESDNKTYYKVTCFKND